MWSSAHRLSSHAFPLAEVARAHALYAAGGVTGKIVLTV